MTKKYYKTSYEPLQLTHHLNRIFLTGNLLKVVHIYIVLSVVILIIIKGNKLSLKSNPVYGEGLGTLSGAHKHLTARPTWYCP